MTRKTVVRKMYEDFMISGKIETWDEYLKMEKMQNKNILKEGQKIAYDDSYKQQEYDIKWLIRKLKHSKKNNENLNFDDIIFLIHLAFT